MLTGQACHRLRDAANLWGSWPHSLWTYPEILEDAGYTIGMEGKGWGPGVVFQKSSARRNRNPAGRTFASFNTFLEAKPEGRPFCFWFGSHNPHQPWTAKARHYAGLDKSKIKLPAYLPDHPEVRQAIINYYAEVQAYDEELGTVLDELKARGLDKNTLVVAMGDNGWQTPRGLANVYDAGTRTPLAIRWPGKVKQGALSDAFVSFEDLAPTFLEAAGLTARKDMTGRSLLPLLDGQADVEWRDGIFLERERHANVRVGDGSYPCRALRTDDFLYVWNLQPERWPAGDPEMHMAVGPYGDVDNTPFKTLILAQRDQPGMKRFFELGFAKRPAEELYDLRTDPDQVTNIASDPAHAKRLATFRKRVLEWMKKTGDPRAKDAQSGAFDGYKYFGSKPKPHRLTPRKAYLPEL
jgi:arylsulfatase A-like enzyme